MVKTICVVGLGYVGLPTALFFAEAGYSVIGADIKKELIEKLSSGKSSIPEILDDARIQKLQKAGRIRFTSDTPQAVRDSDAILITVPTPIYEDSTLPDLRPVEGAAKAVAEGMAGGAGKGKLVILESTVYPGVTEEIVQPIIEKKTGLKAGRDYGLAYCPERYNPGDREHTIDKMQRIVGAIDEHWLDIAAEMYSKITAKGVKKVSSIKTAEAAKVIENTQRDLNIGLMNELALIFDKIGLDTREVIEAASTKWNFHVYWPGPGVGGHCLPVDPYYLVWKSQQLGYEPKIITAGRQVNDYMAIHAVNLAERMLKSLKGKKVAVLGASYKGNVADARETPARRICAELKKRGAHVVVYDPLVDAREIAKWGVETADFEGALKGADCFIIHSEHDEFKSLDLGLCARLMRTKAIVDSRGFVGRKEAAKRGFLLERI
jgi:nucleotide sugar dehydrogenase